MFQSIEIDAAVRAAKTRLSMFAGERLRLVILNRGAGASVCVTIADNDQSDPVVELVGSDEIILDSTALTDLAEGADYAFNIWMQDSDGNSLLAYGDLMIRNSIHPVAAWATPEEPLPDPLVLSGTPAASATVGTAYDFQPTVTGGSPAYTFSLTSGTLPDGLSLDSATGQIAGTPTQAEIASDLVLCVTDQDTTEDSLPAFGIEVFSPALAAPGNLFTPDQSSLSVTSHLDLRSNWEVVSNTLSSPISGGSPSPGNDVRLSLDTPLIMGRPHFALFDYAVSAGNVKVQLGGDGSVSGKSATVGWANNQFFRAAEVDGNFTRMQLKPTTDFVGTADNLRLYDLSTVDPMTVACDVIIVGGDSNAANATSEQFGVDITAADRQVPYDPRIWYMPCLRVSGSYALTDSLRHVPQPCIEPVATVEAQRMSPVHAVASRLVAYSAARGRPLLVMALGDPGSGLMNTEDWRKSSAVGTTGSRMWNEMVAMKAALDALGRDLLADGGGHLRHEPLHQPRVIGGEDEGADAVAERELDELLHPLVGRALQPARGALADLPADVEQPADLARVPARSRGRLVDRPVAAAEVARLQVPERWEPAVAEPAGEAQHARLVGADVERDRMRRARPALGPGDPVVLAVDAHPAALARLPDAADDGDRLGERIHALAGCQPRATHGGDRVPEAAGTEAELEAAAGEQVEARRAAGDDGRLAQRHVEHVRRDADAVGRRRDPAHQRPRVVEGGLVGVVLERREVEPGQLGRLGEPHGLRRRLVRRCDEHADLELVAVVHGDRIPVPGAWSPTGSNRRGWAGFPRRRASVAV